MLQTYPGEQPHRALTLVSWGTTGPVLDGGAHTNDSRIVTVDPGSVKVAVTVLTAPGKVVTTPASVVTTPGKMVVYVEVTKYR